MACPLSPIDTPWEMKDDTTLQGLVKEVEESILSLDDEREKFAALARSELIQATPVDANQFPLFGSQCKRSTDLTTSLCGCWCQVDQ